MTFAELQEACRILGLGERATLREIKTRHKELVKRYHPDTGNTDEPAMIRRINAAHRVIQDYISGYQFSFTEAEFYEQHPDERIRQQFENDPIWGNG